jgi:flagellar motor component MotA
MENTKLTIWDWIGTALLGILLGSIFAYGFIC